MGTRHSSTPFCVQTALGLGVAWAKSPSCLLLSVTVSTYCLLFSSLSLATRTFHVSVEGRGFLYFPVPAFPAIVFADDQLTHW